MTALVNRPHLVREISVPAAADVRQDQTHFGELVQPGYEIGGQTILLAAVRQHHGAILHNIAGATYVIEEDFGWGEERFLSFCTRDDRLAGGGKW